MKYELQFVLLFFTDLRISVTFEGVNECVDDAEYGPFSCYR